MQGYEYKYNVPVLDATNNAAVRNDKGIMYMEMGQYAAAMSEFKIAISLSPNAPSSAAYYNNLGLLYVKLNQTTRAKECFEQAIKLNPVFLEYHKNLISIYAKSGQANNILNQALAQINADNKNSNAYFTAGLIYAQMGRKDDAKRYLKKYVTLEKTNVLSGAVKQMIINLESE